MANRKERRAAEAQARTQYSKQELMKNWREAQESLMAMRALYRETLTAAEQLRGSALNTQAVLLAILFEQGDITLSMETVEEVEAGALEGWTSNINGNTITIHPVVAEDFEDDAE